jgi:hypothetical protein
MKNYPHPEWICYQLHLSPPRVDYGGKCQNYENYVYYAPPVFLIF